MADELEFGEEKSKKKGKGGLVFLIILILLIGGFVALVKFDVFSLGTNVFYPLIKDVPVINMILPEVAEGEMNDEYSFATIEEAVNSLKETEILLKKMEEEAERLNEQIVTLETENTRLTQFEENQLQFEEEKEQFDKDIANQVGSETFIAYVESVFPENALAIYEELIIQKQFDEDVLAIANMYAEMNAQDAADILEETTNTNMQMVIDILLNIEPDQAGAILSSMEPLTADKISRYMYPDD